MKTSLLIIIFVLILIPIQLVYAPPPPNPKAAFDYSKHVLIGKILSVKILSEPDIQISENGTSIRGGIALYEIEVEEYLKNPLDAKIIKVPGYFLNIEYSRSGYDLPYTVNQRVLLYIQEDHDAIEGYDLIINRESRVLDGPVCNLGTTYHEGLCISSKVTSDVSNNANVNKISGKDTKPGSIEEKLQIASKSVIPEYDQAGSAGPPLMDMSIYLITPIIIGGLIGMGFFLGLMIYWRKRK